MVIPKFKVLDFDKYKWTTCLKNHLKMCCPKMGEFATDQELLLHSFHNMRDFTCCGMQGLWLGAKLRALQSVLQGYTTNCLTFSGISEARLEVGSIVVGNFMCLPHGLRDMCLMRLFVLNEYRSVVI